jgi:hypothetical protein
MCDRAIHSRFVIPTEPRRHVDFCVLELRRHHPERIPVVFVLAVTARKGKSTENALWVKRWGVTMASAGTAFHRKFKIGQTVFYYRGGRDRRCKVGLYIVMRIFSRPDGEIRYRIRSENDPTVEYTVRENELDRR